MISPAVLNKMAADLDEIGGANLAGASGYADTANAVAIARTLLREVWRHADAPAETKNVPAGLTLLTVNLTARAMDALTTGAAAVDCSMTDFVSRALVVYGTIAAELADGSTVSVSEVRP